MTEWELVESEIYAGKLKRYYKKHPRETNAVFDNLDTFIKALVSGVNPLFQAGFIHREPQGVIAISQGSLRGGAKETRLYIYVLEVGSTIHLITIGNKESQQRDLKDCRKVVNAILKGE